MAGEDIRTVQKRARHKDSKTTETYSHDLDVETVWNNLEGVFKPLYDRIKNKITETLDNETRKWQASPSFVYA